MRAALASRAAGGDPPAVSRRAVSRGERMNAFRREVRSIVRLALPVIATQLGSMLLLVVDNLVLGHFSVDAFAASAVGRVWVMGTQLVAQGVLFGLDPIVSQAHGARDVERLGASLQRGLVLALALSVPIGISWCFTERMLLVFGQEPRLAEEAQRYALAQLPGLPFLLGFMVLRTWLQGRRIVRPAMWIVLAANVVNALADCVLVYGWIGLPRLGVAGAGLATSMTQIAMCAGLVAIVRRYRLERGAWTGWHPVRESLRGAREVLRIGLPVAAQLGLEIWAFQIATLWAGRLGAVPLASHQIALNLSSVSFMVPLGIAIGASTRVGNLIGAKRRADAQRAAWVALALGAGAMSVFAVLFVLAKDLLPRIFSTDPSVVALAAGALPIAAAFQLFDGTQVVGGGILRGMGSTRPAALFHLVGFYALGLPLAYYLCFTRALGLRGIWWGLCAGLGAVALALVAWIARRGQYRSYADTRSG